MDSLIRQTRARFSGTRQDNKDDVKDRTIQPQSTQSFKEKRRGPSWIRRQLSRQMSWEKDFSAADYPTAVAAAAYAIQLLEESKSQDQNDANLNKTKSKLDNSRPSLEPLKSALKSSDDASRASFKDQDSASMSQKKPEKAPSMKKRISFADTDETEGKELERPTVKEPERASSMKRPPSFAGPAVQKAPERTPSTQSPASPADEQLNITDSKTPTIATQSIETRKPLSAKPGPADAKAEAWEKEELASIQDRYDKLRATINDWEEKKKKKAKRKLERTEAELDRRREKAVRNYNNEIKRIDTITGGARAQAEENRRNEEFKVQEKANKIRLTGKLPATCLCF